MKKYRIELSEDQMRLIALCLEDVSRFAAGQMEMKFTIEEMGQGLSFDQQIQRRNHAEILLKEVKRVLLPELHEHENKGYNGTEFVGNVYQIYKSIWYRLAQDYNWNNVHSSEPLKSGSMGRIKIESVK